MIKCDEPYYGFWNNLFFHCELEKGHKGKHKHIIQWMNRPQ